VLIGHITGAIASAAILHAVAVSLSTVSKVQLRTGTRSLAIRWKTRLRRARFQLRELLDECFRTTK
jgi:hypothetical protein